MSGRRRILFIVMKIRHVLLIWHGCCKVFLRSCRDRPDDQRRSLCVRTILHTTGSRQPAMRRMRFSMTICQIATHSRRNLTCRHLALRVMSLRRGAHRHQPASTSPRRRRWNGRCPTRQGCVRTRRPPASIRTAIGKSGPDEVIAHTHTALLRSVTDGMKSTRDRNFPGGRDRSQSLQTTPETRSTEGRAPSGIQRVHARAGKEPLDGSEDTGMGIDEWARRHRH